MKLKKITRILATMICTCCIASTLSTTNVFAATKCDYSKQSCSNSYKDVMMDSLKNREKDEIVNLDLTNLDKLNQNEINELVKIAKTNTEFNQLIDKLISEKILTSKNFEIKKSDKIVMDDIVLKSIVFSVDNVFITFIKVGDEYSSVCSVLSKDNILDMYMINNGDLKLFDKIKYDEYEKSLQKYEIKKPRRVKRWKYYGNWCGPNYSGPGAPVDNIDACCMEHDNCYDDLSPGESKKDCDRELIKCLKPIYGNTTWYGRQLIKGMAAAFGLLSLLPKH